MIKSHLWCGAAVIAAFYAGENYPVLQCTWPDESHRFPWDPEFNPNWIWVQPLLFNEEPDSARTVALLESMAD